MQYLSIILTAASYLAGAVTYAAGVPIISDDFETADMSHSAAGFSWDENNRTSVVTMDPVDGPVAVYNNGPIYNVNPNPVDWTAFDGDYSLRFRYPAGENWAEQRFALGGSYADIWVRYWIRVPENYAHPSGEPDNQKWLALWTDNYLSASGVTVVFGLWPSFSGGGNTVLEYVALGAIGNTGYRGSVEFFGPADAGRWMQVVHRVRLSSGSGINDGVIQTYRQWEGEPGFTLLQSSAAAVNTLWPNSGPQGISAGYLMGWANATYPENTEFLIDNFEVSLERFVELGSEPAAPTLLTVQ